MSTPATYRRGNGRLRSAPELRRSVRLGLVLRPGESADLATVADAWGVSPATAAWALVAGALADMRGDGLSLPPEVATRVLRRILRDPEA